MSELKRRAEYLIKHNPLIQRLYRKSMSLAFRWLSLFVRRDEKLVLLSDSGGRKYGDSPRVLFETMKQDPRFAGYQYVWAFESPDEFDVDGCEKVRMDSLAYFLTALRARVWITSVNIERGLRFKKRGTIYINTWHGAGTKRIGNACPGRNDYDFSDVDMMMVQSDFEKEIFVRDFLCRPEVIRQYGFPRNDELFHIRKERIAALRREWGIPEGKKVILYAPTWRDSKDGGLTYDFDPPIDMEVWVKRLSDKYVMLFRKHPFTTKSHVVFNDFVRDAAFCENLNDLLSIADIVLTDYSTIVYDCVIAGKPFLCFGYDYEEYMTERGFYFDLNQEYPGGVLKTQEEVFERIEALEASAQEELYAAFRRKYVQAGGDATNAILDELHQRLN